MPIYYNHFIINHWVNNNLILCGKINDTFNNKYDIKINKENKKNDNDNDNNNNNNYNNDNDDNDNNDNDNDNDKQNDEIKNIYYYDNTQYNIIKKKKYKIYKSKKLNNKN